MAVLRELVLKAITTDLCTAGLGFSGTERMVAQIDWLAASLHGDGSMLVLLVPVTPIPTRRYSSHFLRYGRIQKIR